MASTKSKKPTKVDELENLVADLEGQLETKTEEWRRARCELRHWKGLFKIEEEKRREALYEFHNRAR